MKRIFSYAAVACGFVLTLGSLYLFVLSSPVEVHAGHFDSDWLSDRPGTKKDLESQMLLYTVKAIAARDAIWAYAHELEPGERLVQYRPFFSAPLEVVFDYEDRVTALYYGAESPLYLGEGSGTKIP